jgi:hypothetical protein
MKSRFKKTEITIPSWAFPVKKKAILTVIQRRMKVNVS